MNTEESIRQNTITDPEFGKTIKEAFPNNKIEFVRFVTPDFKPGIGIIIDDVRTSISWDSEIEQDLAVYHGELGLKAFDQLIIAGIQEYLKRYK